MSITDDLNSSPTPTASPTGTWQNIKNFAGTVGNFLTSSTQKFGNTAGNAIAAPANSDLYSQALQQHSDITNKLQQAIQGKQSLGQDTTQLQGALKNHIASTPQQTDFTGNVINTSPEQVLGQAAGTGLEALSGGLLSSGAENVATKGATFGERFLQGAKTFAPYGAVGGISQGMQNNESPVGVATSGAVGAVTSAGIGGLATGGIGAVNDLLTDHPIFKSHAQNLENAQNELNTSSQKGVTALQNDTGAVSDFKKDLGTTFQKRAQDLENANPGKTSIISHENMDTLNGYKTNKSFNLPDYLNTKTNPLANTPETANDIANGGKAVTPTQAQDLITQLNRTTFTEKASGLAVDQSKIGLVNDLKQQFSKDFGPEWDKMYGNYSTGRNAMDKVNDIFNIKSNATSSDMLKSFNSLKKLQSTPAGQTILQNTLNEVKPILGINFESPSAASDVLEKETALKAAQTPGGVTHFIKQQGTRLPGYLVRYLIARELFKAISAKP